MLASAARRVSTLVQPSVPYLPLSSGVEPRPVGEEAPVAMSVRRQLFLCGLAGVVLGSCSAEHADVTSTNRNAASKPSAPVTMPATPARTTTFGRLTQAVVKLANPDGIVAVAGGLWVKTDDGRAVRVDPTSNKITAQVSLDEVSDPNLYCQGIGSDGERVWACAAEHGGTALAQIDPASARVLRRIQVGKLFDQLSLPANGRGIWVLTGDGSTVQVVDPTNGRGTTYPLGEVCQQLAVDGDRLIATGSVANVAVTIDARTGAVIRRIPLRGPRIAAMLGGDAWVDTDDGLTRIGPDLAIRAVYPDLVAGAGGDVLAAAGSIWVRAGDGTISRVDPRTGRVLERITPDRPLTSGSIYIAFGSIWTTSNDDGTLVRLRIEG